MKARFDLWLAFPVVLLSLTGVTILRGVAPDYVWTQMGFFIIALLVFLIFALTDYVVVFSFTKLLYLFSTLFLTTPFFFGVLSRGAHRWLQLGQFNLQPSEVVKPFLIIAFAKIMASRHPHRYLWLGSAAILPALIIFLQPDLGTTLVLLVGWGTIGLSRINLKQAVFAVLIFLSLAAPAYRFLLHDYQRSRLISLINPYQDPLGQGYHIIQSTIAAGSGKFTGRGLGHGTQSQLRFLPEYHTDFIFASLAESFGFIGSITVVSLLLFWLWRIYRISQATDEWTASLFCLATCAQLAFQVFINIGMNLGIAPITGITLPFLSYGGSSLVSLAITVGIINSISVRSAKSYTAILQT